MKKRILAAAALAALLLAAAYAWLRPGGEPVPAVLEPQAGRDYAMAELVYDEGLRLLSGTQTIIARNRSGEALPDVMLRLPMNAQDGASCSVSGVHVNGERVSFSQDEDETVLTIRHDWAQDEELTISFSLMVRHAPQQGVPVVTLPYLAMREDGEWRTDAYDGLAGVSCAHAFDFSVMLDGVCAAAMRGARDMSFALPGGAVREGETGGVRIRAMAGHAGAANTLLRCAQEAIESLNEAGIAYPYDMLTIADGETLRADGDVFSGLIVTDADADGETLLRRATRLIARQTYGIWIGNDPWSSPWMSESMASAAEMLAYERRKGTAAYEARLYDEMEIASRVTRPFGVTVGAGTEHFGGDAEMTQVLRDQGGAMLLGLREAMGAEAFVTALSLYGEACGGKIAVRGDVCDALEAVSGSSWSGYLEDGLAQ